MQAPTIIAEMHSVFPPGYEHQQEPEEGGEWLLERRRSLLGGTPVRPRSQPAWATGLLLSPAIPPTPAHNSHNLNRRHSLESGEEPLAVPPPAGLRPLPRARERLYHVGGDRNLAEVESLLAVLQKLWYGRPRTRGSYAAMQRQVEELADRLLAVDTREPVVYSFAAGALDLFVAMMCEPPLFTDAAGSLAHQSAARSYLSIVAEMMRVLTDVIICSPELSWYLYDRHPGVLYRLLEFMTVVDLALVCGTMLEQIVSNLGPVFEIAANPAVARLLQSKSDVVVTCGCRIAALLVMPGLSLGISPFGHRRLMNREMIFPFKRVQRVIDSNVLWLLGEEGLIERMILLSEVRSLGGVRVQGGNRTYSVLNYEQISQAISAAAAALPGGDAADTVSDDVDDSNNDITATALAAAAERMALAAATGAAGDGRPGLGQQLVSVFGELQRRGLGGTLLQSLESLGIRGSTTTATAPTPTAAAGNSDQQQQQLHQRVVEAMAAARAAVGGGMSHLPPATTAVAPLPAALGVVDPDEWEDTTSTSGDDSEGGGSGIRPRFGDWASLTHDGDGEEEGEFTSPHSAALDDDPDAEEVAAAPHAAIATAVLAGDMPDHPDFPWDGEDEGEEEDGEFYDEEEEDVGEYYDEEGEDPYLDDEDDMMMVGGGGGGGGGGGPGWDADGVEDAVDQALMQDSTDEETRVNLNWLYGSVDTRERWRQRDPTLVRERDDNRAKAYGGATTPEDVAAFFAADRAGLAAIGAGVVVPPRGYQLVETQQTIVNSQSEMLYLLNVMLSTFYFSEPWEVMRRCRWMARASVIFDAAFGLDEAVSTLVDLTPEVHLSAAQRRLPRFLTFRREGQTVAVGEVVVVGASDDATTTPAVLQPDIPLPGGYRLLPYAEIFGAAAAPVAVFATDRTTPNLRQEDEYFDSKENAQGPDTVRKLELIRGVHEFWNAQDHYECDKLHAQDITAPSDDIARKMCRVLLNGKEDRNVEIAAFTMLELYVRGFSHRLGAECRIGGQAPQTELGRRMLPSILRNRIYNAARIPGLTASLSPPRRIEAINGFLAELLCYHHRNLRVLAQYVKGAVDLSDLNSGGSGGGRAGAGSPNAAPANDINSDNAPALSATTAATAAVPGVNTIRSAEQAEVARILGDPPLDREAHEPFASVLLRRTYGYGIESHLLVRALAASLTPGLRSARNYAFKQVGQRSPPVNRIFTARTLSQDLVTGNPQRLAFVRRTSRAYAVDVSLALLEERRNRANNNRGNGSNSTPSPSPSPSPSPPSVVVAKMVVGLVQSLTHAPHRLTLAERALPNLFDETDMAIIRGSVQCPVPGTAAADPAWSVPLFEGVSGGGGGGDNDDDAAGLSQLAPLADTLLAEPHALIFCMMRQLSADGIDDINFLGAITTSLLVVLRVARLRGSVEDGVAAVLAALRPLAAAEYDKWRAEVRESAAEAAAAAARDIPCRPSCCSCTPPAGYCEAAAGEQTGASYRCPVFNLFGDCRPDNAAREYFRCLGGCFYRNYFRVLCVWIAHYATCQRYIETLYFCTEVAFAEYKVVCMSLMRELPGYFQDPILY